VGGDRTIIFTHCFYILTTKYIMPPKKKTTKVAKEPSTQEIPPSFHNYRFPKGNLNPANNYLDAPITPAEYNANVELINPFLSDLNQEIKTYVQEPTENRKRVLEENLSKMSSQTALYSELPFATVSRMKEPLRNTKEDINNAQKILEYIPYSSSNSFSEKTRRPKPSYTFNPESVIDLFVDFAEKVLTPTVLAELIFNYSELILEIFSKKTTPTSGSVLLEMLIDKNELEKKIIAKSTGINEKEANYAYTSIVSAFNMFISLGNFETTGSGVVESLNAEEPINREELDRSAFIMISTHGTLMTSPKRTPNGVSVFMQKQAEPLKPSINCGSAQMEKCLGDCIIRKEKKCKCIKRFLDYQQMARVLSTEINGEMGSNKIPSLMELQHLMNEQKMHQMGELFTFLPEKKREFVYEKSSHISESKYVARIPVQSTRYAEKIFSTEPKSGLLGVYNLMTGDVINANPNFVSFHRALADRGSPNIGTVDLYEIPPVGTPEITHSEENPRVVFLFTMTSLLEFFDSLNYHNVFILDLSCESPENPNMPEEELTRKSNMMGNLGLGRRTAKRRRNSNKKSSKRKMRH